MQIDPIEIQFDTVAPVATTMVAESNYGGARAVLAMTTPARGLR